MKGYWNNLDATRETIDADGWLHTGQAIYIISIVEIYLLAGDVVYFDENGYYYVIDRIKDLIKVGGMQVSPTEIEQSLAQIEGVNDVAVIGIDDERLGQVPRAYVVVVDKQISAADIENYIRGLIEIYRYISPFFYNFRSNGTA